MYQGGEDALQATCDGFDSHRLHLGKGAAAAWRIERKSKRKIKIRKMIKSKSKSTSKTANSAV